jgi:hypothetical protein
MEPKVSLPSSKDSATGSYPEPVHILKIYIFKMDWNTTLSRLGLPNDLYASYFPTKILDKVKGKVVPLL